MKNVKLKDLSLVDMPTEARYDSHIKYANKIREITETDEALAVLCCSALSAYRNKKGKDYLPHQAYIFDQFKRPEEINLLRQVYGSLFISVSLYSGRDNRISSLSKRFSEDHVTTKPGLDDELLASALINRDANEQDQTHGQRLSDTFSLGDIFLNIDDQVGSEKILNRFLDGIFGSNKVSPTIDEYGMYMAKSASLRSLDLSRQVGAAIFSKDGEVLTMGCNEVPKGGGGTYWSSDTDDARDYTLDGDENEKIKRGIFADVVRRLDQIDLIKKDKDINDIIKLVIEETAKKGSVLKEAQLMDLLEFGRIIHAEMSAISDAARLGKSVKKSVLYCTTFPCHICAKHIVAAGIRRVVYIEPYPKSYAEQLHKDSIIVGVKKKAKHKVVFAPFIGISPIKFRDIFSRTRRKDREGQFNEWSEQSPRPIMKFTVATYMENEKSITLLFDKKLQQENVSKYLSISDAADADREQSAEVPNERA